MPRRLNEQDTGELHLSLHNCALNHSCVLFKPVKFLQLDIISSCFSSFRVSMSLSCDPGSSQDVASLVYTNTGLPPGATLTNTYVITEQEQPVSIRKYIQDVSIVTPDINIKPGRVHLCCKSCDYKTFHKHALERHVQAVHDKIKFYQCSRCEYRTGHSSALKRHESKVHEKNSQIAYVCDICDYQTVHKSALKRHVANRHEKETQITHACSICDYKTTYEFALQRHYTTVHLKEGVYECGQCEYNTVHKHALDRHVKMVHEKPANLSCVHCDYKSAHKSSLRLHYATVHESKDTYKCDKCGYETLYKTALNRHQSTVTCGLGDNRVMGAATLSSRVSVPSVDLKPPVEDPLDVKHQIMFDAKDQTIVIQSPGISVTGVPGELLPFSLPQLPVRLGQLGELPVRLGEALGDTVHLVREGEVNI